MWKCLKLRIVTYLPPFFDPGYPGKPWVYIYSLMGNGRKTDLCVFVSQLSVAGILSDFFKTPMPNGEHQIYTKMFQIA
jgi:hypothetical protein